MVNIRIVGSIHTSSGYSCHTRSLFSAVYKINPSIWLDVPLPTGWEVMVSDAELECVQKNNMKIDWTLAVITPDYWQSIKVQGKGLFAGFFVWEGDSVPERFWSGLECADKVFVPSQHVLDAVQKSCPQIVPKTFIVPHGVDKDLFRPIEKDKSKTPFTFICNKGWRAGINDRGGVQWILKSFSEEFRKGENVRLLIKVNTAYCGPDWSWEAEVEKLCLPKDRAEILVNTENLPYSHLPFLYAEGDVFVCATMCEGFNLPGLEAHACGLPTIQTGWGGQVDYMLEGIDEKITYKMIENIWDQDYEGILWSMPNLEHLKKLLRQAFIQGRSEAKRKGELARKSAVEGWTWEHTARKLLEFLT